MSMQGPKADLVQIRTLGPKHDSAKVFVAALAYLFKLYRNDVSAAVDPGFDSELRRIRGQSLACYVGELNGSSARQGEVANLVDDVDERSQRLEIGEEVIEFQEKKKISAFVTENARTYTIALSESLGKDTILVRCGDACEDDLADRILARKKKYMEILDDMLALKPIEEDIAEELIRIQQDLSDRMMTSKAEEEELREKLVVMLEARENGRTTAGRSRNRSGTTTRHEFSPEIKSPRDSL